MLRRPQPDANTTDGYPGIFLEQVDFFHIPLTEQAKWLLFFVTRVLRLRDDGMEVGVIADRLADIRGRPISAAELDTIDNYFKPGGGGDVTRTYRNNPRMKPYKIVDAAARTKFFYDLGAGLQVFLSYPSTFGTAKRVYDILRTIGLKPWLDKERSKSGQMQPHIINGIRDSCLIAFLITNDFRYQGMIKLEVDEAIKRYDDPKNGRTTGKP